MIQKKPLSTLPEFPSDVPTAPIARISLTEIQAGNPDELAAALEACRGHGFFYLDLRNTDLGEALLSEAEDLQELSQSVFDTSIDYKSNFALVKGVNLFGYKEAGTVKKTDPSHRPDTTEFFNIAKDHLHGVTESRTYPSELLDHVDTIKSFQKNAHEVGMLVLASLAKQLELPPSTFSDKNLFNMPSGDHCRLTHKIAHPSDKNAIGLPSHTDFGSITILFNWLGGLQIQSHDQAKNSAWEYVKPEAGHAIINLGDAMVTFTNGMLKSAKHRVVPAPGEQMDEDRYSVVYFVRPHNDVMMEPVEKFRNLGDDLKVAGKFEPQGEKTVSAGEWMRQRSMQMGS